MSVTRLHESHRCRLQRTCVTEQQDERRDLLDRDFHGSGQPMLDRHSWVAAGNNGQLHAHGVVANFVRDAENSRVPPYLRGPP